MVGLHGVVAKVATEAIVRERRGRVNSTEGE
jgi:hypothetical protein